MERIGREGTALVIEHGHPIVEGIGEYFEIEHAEMYGEPFDIPEPDTLIFVSWFPGGEVFRSGCCYLRGKGKIFYFRPDTKPIQSITIQTFCVSSLTRRVGLPRLMGHNLFWERTTDRKFGVNYDGCGALMEGPSGKTCTS